MSNAYDRVRYPGGAYALTHPAALGALAVLHGRRVAPFGASRVLEIGCGEGVNLLNMALGAPGAEFVGVDLAETAIAAARETAVRIGLGNAAFHVLDLAAIDDGFGDFDTIIAHGVYAWTPEPVRTALMRVVGERLSTDGLALISFNALPGARFRQALRDILIFLADGVDDPRAALDLGRAFLAEQIESWSDTKADQALAKSCATHMLERRPEVLYHDELNPNWAPELLSQVIARAAPFGLDYVCDAQPKLSAEAFFPAEEHAALRTQASGNWARFEQLADFRALRAFRNAVFARGRVEARPPSASRLRGLWASAELRIEEPDPTAEGGALLVSRNGVEVRTNNRELVDLLIRLGQAFPLSVALTEAHGLESLADHLYGLFVSGVRSARLGAAGAGAHPRRASGGEPTRARAGCARRDRLTVAAAHDGGVGGSDIARHVAADGRNTHARRAGGGPVSRGRRPPRRGQAAARRPDRATGWGGFDGGVAAGPTLSRPL